MAVPRSMGFHSTNRSQSAVCEPTRLSVRAFEAMSSALNQNNAGICCLRCAELADQQESIVRRLLPNNHAPLRLLPANGRRGWAAAGKRGKSGGLKFRSENVFSRGDRLFLSLPG